MNAATEPHSFKWRWLAAAAAVVVLPFSLYRYTVDRVPTRCCRQSSVSMQHLAIGWFDARAQ